MNFSRKYIEALNKDNNFIQNNLEKVVRLLDVLKFISTELDPSGDKLILKGGTAINLMYTNLARLSVDIDLDYIGSLDKEKARKDRDKIMDALDNYMLGEDYEISSKSRGSVILVSRTYTFTNASHNKDNIKVEINFINRIHICPSVRKKINYFEKEVMVQTLLLEELFGMKICALIDRSKPRDLFVKDDSKELYDLLGTDEHRRDAATQFKDINSNFKIAIVVDMWLTGFDVPFLDTIYIDKLLKQEHSIIQTISRVNRAFPGKNSGLIVDFIGIKYGVNRALKKYAKYDNDNIEGIEKAIEIVKDKIEVFDAMFYKFDSDKYFNGNGQEKLICLNNAAEFVQLTKDLETRFMTVARIMSKAFGLCNAAKDFKPEELDKIHFYIAVRSIIFKLSKGHAPDISQLMPGETPVKVLVKLVNH